MTDTSHSNIIERHIEITSEMIANKHNPLDILSVAAGLSKQRIKEAMRKGTVWLSVSPDSSKAKAIRRKNVQLKAGNQLHLYYNPEILAQAVPAPQLVADETDYSIWHKPYGVWSHGSKWGDHCSIGRLVEQHFDFKRQTFIVHRLDRAANGLILIAHNKNAAHKLSELFIGTDNTITKSYRAQVSGQFPSEAQSIEIAIDDKSAKSHAKLLEYNSDSNQSLVEVVIETGRKHQIRKHLAAIGFPIIGDRLYGNADKETIDLQLTADQLQFTCPLTGEAKSYQALATNEQARD